MKVSSPKSNRVPRLYLHLFGSFEAIRGEAPIHFPTHKTEALFAFLVLHPEPHAREKLAALFWGNVSDEQARVSLRYALGQLRKKVDGELLLADRETVQLNPDFPIWVDATEFKGEIRKMFPQTTRTDEGKPILHPSFLTLYSGDLLTDFYDDWIFPEREHFRQLYLDALLQLTQQYRAHSQYAQAIETAQRVLERDPANERAHQHLMFCFVAHGNRHAALQQYAQCVRALHEEFAIDPAPETTALYEWIKQTPGESFSPAARITNLPFPLTSFIGRGQEMVQLKTAITPNLFGVGSGEQVRLLTLIGAGGSGKTRLAIQAATDLIDAYKDGVWWVELGALADGALVTRAVANALGVRESIEQPLLDTIAHFLRERQLLLVLDNCEHLLDACAQLARTLLEQCANLQILATSREPLGFIGESVQGISPLEFPDPNAASITESLMQYAAVRLFVVRAAAVNSHFVMNAQNASAVAQICARLDGIPLALELAAAWVRELSVEEIAARLEDRFSFLTRGNRGVLPRQQTLLALISWSYGLLSEPERVMLQRLSVFTGRWTLEIAKDVCEANENAEAGLVLARDDILDLLTRLVDKSLVVLDEQASETRYRMLETNRDYARERLLESGEHVRVRTRHLGVCLQFAEQVEEKLVGAEQLQWMNRLQSDHDNLCAALSWALAQGESGAALRLSGALGWFWFVRGYFSEGRQWLQQALALSRRIDNMAELPPEHRRWYAKASHAEGRLALFQGDSATAQALFEESLRLFQELKDKQGIAHSLNGLGLVAYNQGDLAAAWTLLGESLVLSRELGDKQRVSITLFILGCVADNQGDDYAAQTLREESLALRRELGDRRGIAVSLQGLGQMKYIQGNIAAAQTLVEESLILGRELQDKRSMAESLDSLALMAVSQGDFATARARRKECLGLRRALGDKHGMVRCLVGLARVAQADRQLQHAVLLLGAAKTILESLNAVLGPTAHAEFESLIASTREQLDQQTFTAKWTEGSVLTLEGAIELAMSDYTLGCSA